MRRLTLCCLLFILLIPVLLPAQSTPSQNAPPAVLQIYHESVKPGRGLEHAKLEATFTNIYKKANPQHYYLAANAMTGPMETWFFVAFKDMEDAEKAEANVVAHKSVQAELERLSVNEAPLLNGVTSEFAFYEPDLSYRPEFNLGEFKYFTVDTIHIRSGQYDKFVAYLKAVKAAHEKANMDEHMVVYYVGMGAQSTTALMFQPFRSLKEIDQLGKIHGEGSAFQKAMAEESNKTAADVFKREGRESSRTDLLAISPSMSLVSDQVIATSPSFWKPKAEVAKAPAAKPVTPAAQKEAEVKKEPAIKK